MRTLLIALQYDGTSYQGWQRQAAQPTVQAVVEGALSRACGCPIRVMGAGRTDVGVHAAAQVASFRTESRIPVDKLCQVLNGQLPVDVSAWEAREVSPGFHARRCAREKTYLYRIWNSPLRSAFSERYRLHHSGLLDLAAMACAAGMMVGEHDFSAFAKREAGDRRNPVRRVSQASVENQGQEVIITISAGGFLQHMVRGMVGALLKVGERRLGAEAVSRMLAEPSSAPHAPSAPPVGLCLARVVYDCEHLQAVFEGSLP